MNDITAEQSLSEGGKTGGRVDEGPSLGPGSQTAWLSTSKGRPAARSEIPSLGRGRPAGGGASSGTGAKGRWGKEPWWLKLQRC